MTEPNPVGAAPLGEHGADGLAHPAPHADHQLVFQLPHQPPEFPDIRHVSLVTVPVCAPVPSNRP